MGLTRRMRLSRKRALEGASILGGARKRRRGGSRSRTGRRRSLRLFKLGGSRRRLGGSRRRRSGSRRRR